MRSATLTRVRPPGTSGGRRTLRAARAAPARSSTRACRRRRRTYEPPCRGHAQTQRQAGDVTDATARFIAEIGEPRIDRFPGEIERHVWEVEPSGDALLRVRLSTHDLKSGKTVMGQVRRLKRLVEEEGESVPSAPRPTTAAGNDYHDRPNCVRRGADWSRLVTSCFWRNLDRLARDSHAGELYFALLKRNGVALYLDQLGGHVDWAMDGAFLAFERALLDEEARLLESLASRRRR